MDLRTEDLVTETEEEFVKQAGHQIVLTDMSCTFRHMSRVTLLRLFGIARCLDKPQRTQKEGEGEGASGGGGGGRRRGRGRGTGQGKGLSHRCTKPVLCQLRSPLQGGCMRSKCCSTRSFACRAANTNAEAGVMASWWQTQ